MTMTRPTTEQITHKGQLLSAVLDRAINVLDFGAVGDGVTDDFDAFVAATSALRSAGGGTLYIPMTANGYYLRRNPSASPINLSAMSNVAIVSDGATLKLQGGTSSQTGSAAVISATGSALTSNIVIRGLRFVSASTVLRYGNSSSPVGFDQEVDDGRADPLEQTNFRYGIAFGGPVKNLAITDCYFGPAMFYPISVANNVTSDVAYGLQFSNLTFEGVNQQCMRITDSNGMVISDIVNIDKRGCRFDWLFYLGETNRNVSVVNVTCVNAVKPPASFGSNGVQMGGVNHRLTNAHFENYSNQTVNIQGDNAQIADCCFKNCSNGVAVLVGVSQSTNTITNCVFENCGLGIQFSGSAGNLRSARIDNCTFVNIDTRAVYMAGGTSIRSLDMSDCIIIDGGQSLACIRSDSDASVRNLSFRNISFRYASFVPTFASFDLRGSATTATIDGCSFASNFGTSAIRPISGTASVVRVSNCSLTGYSVGLGLTASVVLAAATQTPPSETVLTANSATPSVAGTVRFVTANASATAITNFADGVEGQEITVRVNDANTTFDFSGTSLKGNNGVDYAATSGDLLFATRLGSNWYCTICQA